MVAAVVGITASRATEEGAEPMVAMAATGEAVTVLQQEAMRMLATEVVEATTTTITVGILEATAAGTRTVGMVEPEQEQEQELELELEQEEAQLVGGAVEEAGTAP